MINAQFYSTINELVKRATTGAVSGVVDYTSFVDVGRKLSETTAADWKNAFWNEVVNKVSLTIDYVRSYNGAYADLVKGNSNGGVIELISHVFYNAKEAPFVDLKDGSTIDPFKINKPSIYADYYTDEVAWQYDITKSDTELKAAWKSPEEMDRIITSMFIDVANSRERDFETNRINMVNKLIVDSITTPEEADENKGATSYKLLTIYNTKMGTNLTAAQALYDADFMHFFVQAFNKVSKKLAKVSDKYNVKGTQGFTPESDQKKVIPVQVAEAIKTSTINAFNAQPAILEGVEEVPFWQNIDNELVITKDNSQDTTAPVIGLIFDKTFSVGEYRSLDTATSIYNPKGLYTNFFWSYKSRYIVNEHAASVVFLLA